MNKKTITKVCALIVPMLLVSAVSIQSVSAQTIIDTAASTGIGATVTNTPSINPATVREKIRADVDARVQNVKNNQEIRNQVVENNRLSTTTQRVAPPNSAVNPVKYRVLNGLSSTSPALKRAGYEENGNAMIQNALRERKELLAKHLGVAIQNLTNLRARINSRIEKDRLAGKDLTQVKDLLKIADDKILIAKEAVNAVRNYNPTDSELASSTSSTTKVFNLDQVRNLIDKAHISIKDTHKALNDVIVAIAKISGLKVRQTTATSTPVQTSTTTATSTQTSTTTSTSTNQ